MSGNLNHQSLHFTPLTVSLIAVRTWLPVCTRQRKFLEVSRPASAQEIILSDDGSRLLEGITTNFFVVARSR